MHALACARYTGVSRTSFPAFTHGIMLTRAQTSHRLRMLGVVATALFAACARTAEAPLSPNSQAVAPNALQPFAGPTSPTRLIISEVMADPATISDANGEWFELHNPGAAPVSMA